LLVQWTEISVWKSLTLFFPRSRDSEGKGGKHGTVGKNQEREKARLRVAGRRQRLRAQRELHKDDVATLIIYANGTSSGKERKKKQ